jgi:hypothetical protein
MASHLGEHFKAQRLQRGLNPHQLAKLAGYANISKGANRIQRFEDSGDIHPDLFEKLSALLAVDSSTIDALIEQDRRTFFAEWNAWANEPIRPHLVIRAIPGVYVQNDLPENVTEREAEEFAAAEARRLRAKVWLVLSRRFSIRFDKDGQIEDRTEAVPGEPNTPYMWLGNKSFCLGAGESFVRPQNWPQKPGPKTDGTVGAE